MVKFIAVLVLACVLAVNADETQVAAVFDVRLNASVKCSILTRLTVDLLKGAPVLVPCLLIPKSMCFMAKRMYFTRSTGSSGTRTKRLLFQ